MRSAANTAKHLKKVFDKNLAISTFAGTKIRCVYDAPDDPSSDRWQTPGQWHGGYLPISGFMKQALKTGDDKMEPTPPPAGRDFKELFISSEGQLDPCTVVNRDRVCCNRTEGSSKV